ncbi:hypothetical protein J7T55_014766 [Diaporthe amygdali]|uniref:uncharacterized protein n=1 Tax=Phomopsis amygdali TaxID=1214568 RepID=UPI0022FEDD5A|nr:uncharacterized protein J7T55_014766 [Diaporthe amygdali]KAJ0109964.1 hypothetical protein J7T55_014766 [Diaporthe amygdali]
MRALVIRSEDSARVNKPVVMGLPRDCAVLIPAYPAPNLVWPPRVRRGMREVVSRDGFLVFMDPGHLGETYRMELVMFYFGGCWTLDKPSSEVRIKLMVPLGLYKQTPFNAGRAQKSGVGEQGRPAKGVGKPCPLPCSPVTNGRHSPLMNSSKEDFADPGRRGEPANRGTTRAIVHYATPIPRARGSDPHQPMHVLQLWAIRYRCYVGLGLYVAEHIYPVASAMVISSDPWPGEILVIHVIRSVLHNIQSTKNVIKFQEDGLPEQAISGLHGIYDLRPHTHCDKTAWQLGQLHEFYVPAAVVIEDLLCSDATDKGF